MSTINSIAKKVFTGKPVKQLEKKMVKMHKWMEKKEEKIEKKSGKKC